MSFPPVPGGIFARGIKVLWPTGDPSGAGDAAALNGAVSAIAAAGVPGGLIVMGYGNWYLRPGAVVIALPAVPVMVQGYGRGLTMINAVGGAAGDVIRMYNPTSNTGGGTGGITGGGVKGITIEGGNAPAATALHIGDIEGAELDVCAQNFFAGGVGVHVDNTIWWTEKLSGLIYTLNNSAGVVFDMSGTGASVQNSHAYDDLKIVTECTSGQQGIVVQGGANLYNGSVQVRGNYNTGSSAATCLTITGTAANGPDAGSYSQIANCHLDIQVESNGLTPFPTTVSLGSVSAGSHNAIRRCTGIMSFFNSWSGANAYGNNAFATGAIDFDGYVQGDTNLGPAGPGRQLASALLYGTGFPTVGATTAVPTQIGDFFSFTLTASTVISLLGYLAATSSGPQRKVIRIKQAAAGAFTVTWPHNASPTAAAPTVQWAGGTAPVMTAAANATDEYDLTTMDGITWTGRVTANVS